MMGEVRDCDVRCTIVICGVKMIGEVRDCDVLCEIVMYGARLLFAECK